MSDELEALEAPPEAPTLEEQQPPDAPADAVHIIVNEQGNGDVTVVATGDVRATEVETLLQLALKKWRQQIGV